MLSFPLDEFWNRALTCVTSHSASCGICSW